MQVIPDKKGRTNAIEATLDIALSNGIVKTIGYGDFLKESLKDVLQKCKAEIMKWDDIVCIKPSGEVGGLHLTEDEKKKCNVIIHTSSVAAGGVGI